MATTLKLRTDIKKLKGALSSKSLPAPIKAKLKAQLDKAQNELKAMQSGAKPRKVSTTKGTKTALTSLQKLVNKKKFSVYQGKGIDLKKDADQGALAVGRRVSKGIKGNQFGDAKSSKGNVYYEYRANRLDVKQPKKAQKYPKLEDGGMMAKGGKIPSNVEEFAKRKGISSMVSKIAGWAEKAGKKITGGTAIGKNYDTLILDLSYQDNAIYIDIEDGTITIYDEVVNNFNSFKNAIEKHKMEKGGYMAKGGELKVSTYHLMPLVMTNDKMMVPKYDYIITFEGTEDEALAKAKDMLNKEVVNVNVTLINPNAKSFLNRRKTIAMVKDKMAHGGKTQGYDDKEDERLGMEYGKMSSKDLNSTHARRDDARFEERMAKGGEIDYSKQTSDDFKLGEIVWDTDNKIYGTIIGIYDKYASDKYEVRLDTDGMQPTENLRKVGSKGDKGTKEQLKEAIEDYARLVKSYPKNNYPQQRKEFVGKYAEGGISDKEVVESNAEMVLSKIKEVHHHADELGDIVTNKSDIEAWVVAKIERASTDLSDITHYLDGQHEKMSMGGSINNYVHKMDKK